jgi:C-terminal processing protease CtpA/Prc
MESAMLGLKDAHSLLYRQGRLSPHYDYMEGQEAYYDWEVIRRNYIRDSLGHENHVFWGTLDRHIGYIRMDVFDISDVLIRAIRTFRSMEVSAIIFDVRHNKGGNSNLVPRLLGQMVRKKTALGAYVEKNGPGHNDVTPPVWIYAEPDETVSWDIPIVVLTDKVSYSATSYFAAMVKGLPGMTLVGQTTGGGAGGHLGYQLSNGWFIRVSVSDFIGKDLKTIETGVEPDIHIENTPEDLSQGRDVMLETAMKTLF